MFTVDPDCVSTAIVLAILLFGALAAVIAAARSPAENLSETNSRPDRWS